MGLDCLFRPRSIALIGASHSVEKLGGALLKNLLWFKGKVYPVNPAYKELMGLRAYPDFREIPAEAVDLTIIIRPAPEVPSILRDIGDRTRVAIVVSSGFAEAGNIGLQEEIKEICKASGIRLLGPNCMGLYNPHHRLDTLFFTHDRVKRPPKGHVALLCQSGAVLTSLLDMMGAEKIGVSIAAHYGNASDVNESDIFAYLAEDANTRVVISYIESVEDGRRFIGEARALSLKKPLMVLKAGKSRTGQAAARTHTGRLAGSYEIFSAALRQFGIKEAMSLEELSEALKALAYQRPAPGDRVLIVTNGGGSGALAADECFRQGLEVPPLPAEASDKLKNIFPYFFGIGNPTDLTAQVRDADYETVLDSLEAHYDGFLVIALAGVTGITAALAGLLSGFRARTKKPLVLHTAQGRAARLLKAAVEKEGIPVFPSPEGAVRALKALLKGPK